MSAELHSVNLPDLLAFTQTARLFSLSFAPGSGIEEGTLLPQELSGVEGISEGFTYPLTCLSADAFLKLKQFIGQPVQVALLTDGGEQRALCGLVTRAECAGSDGGFSRYVLTLKDPFAVLERRVNSRVLQDLSVREFVSVLLSEHRQNNPVEVRYDLHHSANDEDDYARYGKLRIGAHAFASKCFTGKGSHRELAVGRHFELTDHPVHDQDGPEDRQFTVLHTRLFARNNLLQDDTGGEPVFRTEFDAVRKHVPIIPAFSATEHAKPIARRC